MNDRQAAGPHGLLLFTYCGVGPAWNIDGIDARPVDSRERLLADVLQAHGLQALHVHAPTESERRGIGGNRDLSTLSHRLTHALGWLSSPDNVRDARFGVLGWDGGCSVATRIAARSSSRVAATVLCGTPLAPSGGDFAQIVAPTLLIVGGKDVALLRPCRQAMRQLGGAKRIEVVPGAGHLFSEKATWETAAHLAGAWLSTHR